jgi:hypothetical protein
LQHVDILPLLDRVPAAVRAALALLICIAFAAAAVKCRRALRFLRSVRKEQDAHLHGLRIHRMLGRLDIDAGRYMRRAGFVDVERHLWRCANCRNLPACDAFLQGQKGVSPRKFCPNHEELIRFHPPRSGEPGSAAHP